MNVATNAARTAARVRKAAFIVNLRPSTLGAGRGKMLVHPRLLRWLNLSSDDGSLFTVEIETDRQEHLSAHGHGEEVGDAGGWLVQPKQQLLRVSFLSHSLDQASEGRRAAIRFHPLSHSRAGKPEQAGQRFPCLALG